MEIVLLVLAIFLDPAPAQAQGTIKGCITDKSGAVLPGVEVVASNPEAQEKVVTDASGCYQFRSLPAGTYFVTAASAGFITVKREGVTVVRGHSTEAVDFALCLGAMDYIDWILPGGLNEAWKQADAVAHVRIVGTSPVRSECPNNNFEHRAVVIEILKDNAKRSIGPTVTFVQENWASERTPYRAGQEMVVFLRGKPQVFVRLAGPYYVFLFISNEVVSFHSPANTNRITPADFLSKLRAFAKGDEAQ